MSLKKKVFVSTLWSVSGQAGYSAVQLGSNIIFARYLSPAEFGEVGIIMFFVLISNVLIEGGLSAALVRKIDATREDFSTVFLFNFFISLLLYALMILISGNVADYYHNSRLKILLIVTGSIIIINSLNFVQNTRLIKALQFRKISTYNLISIILANCAGITLVLLKFGIWSLVAVIILNPLFLSIILWTRQGSFGKIVFSVKSFRGLYIFGINTTLATIIDTAFNNVYQLVLARWFSITETGYFYQAKKLQDVPTTIIYGTTNSVIFSALSSLQNDHTRFSSAYSKIISYLSMLMGLVTLLIVTYSTQIILLLYGEKWISAGQYLAILAFASFFYVHEMFNRVIFKTFDKTKIILQLEILKKTILAISIIMGVIMRDIRLLLLGFLSVSVISYFINYLFSRRVAGLETWAELKSVGKVLISVVIIYLIFYFIKLKLGPGYLGIVLSVPFVIFAYFAALRIQGLHIRPGDFKNLGLFSKINQ